MTEQQVLTQLLDIGVRLGDGALAEADAELQELRTERDQLLVLMAYETRLRHSGSITGRDAAICLGLHQELGWSDVLSAIAYKQLQELIKAYAERGRALAEKSKHDR